MNDASNALREKLKREGDMRFDAFMAFALYDPQFGYYSQGERIFGQSGDFITSPEISPLFGKTLARAIQSALPACSPHIYEFGAGTGKLARDILMEIGEKIDAYTIIDLSGGLKERQYDTLKEALPAHILRKVRWANTLPDTFNGIVIGNEVLDAMPVRALVYRNGNVQEWWINSDIELSEKPIDGKLQNLLAGTEHVGKGWMDGHLFEWGEQANAFTKTLTERLNGLVLMVDYGDSAERLWAAEKYQGTLRAHYQHVAHDGFLEHIGQQDLTAHVNFSQIYNALTEAGGDLEGYCTQGGFLLGHGLLELAGEDPTLTDPVKGAETRKAIQTLISEADMGEQFKVMAWSRNVNLEGSALNLVFLRQDRSGDL